MHRKTIHLQRARRPVRLGLLLAAASFATGCVHTGASGSLETAAAAPAPLPEVRNEARFDRPVTETDVVQIYGYPVVHEFESRNL